MSPTKNVTLIAWLLLHVSERGSSIVPDTIGRRMHADASIASGHCAAFRAPHAVCGRTTPAIGINFFRAIHRDLCAAQGLPVQGLDEVFFLTVKGVRARAGIRGARDHPGKRTGGTNVVSCQFVWSFLQFVGPL
jgi:hypothetical protein